MTNSDGEGAAVARNRMVKVDGETFVYRRFGSSTSETVPPLVLLQHFRGNLDSWDPALLDVLAADRDVIAVDLRGVGQSTGKVRDNVTDMARDTIAFTSALGLRQVDVLGFSLGGHIAQELALLRPRLVRRLVLAGTAPRGGPDFHNWSDDLFDTSCLDNPTAETFISLFFSGSTDSVKSAWAYLARAGVRTADQDSATTLEVRDGQLQALMEWAIPDSSKLERLAAITQPTFVACGDNDTMMRTSNSNLLAERIPGAQLRIYPDSGHGFLNQYPVAFGEHVRKFLGQ
jgi:pimeloyl-ACP methyl ester carboxylesterase